MIYTASHFAPKHHHGVPVSISLVDPRGMEQERKLKMFTPTGELFVYGKQPEEYTPRYWVLLETRRPIIEKWLQVISIERDYTLLCWEHKGSFCHRNLVARLIQKYRPECFGGSDVA